MSLTWGAVTHWEYKVLLLSYSLILFVNYFKIRSFAHRFSPNTFNAPRWPPAQLFILDQLDSEQFFIGVGAGSIDGFKLNQNSEWRNMLAITRSSVGAAFGSGFNDTHNLTWISFRPWHKQICVEMCGALNSPLSFSFCLLCFQDLMAKVRAMLATSKTFQPPNS